MTVLLKINKYEYARDSIGLFALIVIVIGFVWTFFVFLDGVLIVAVGGILAVVWSLAYRPHVFTEDGIEVVTGLFSKPTLVHYWEIEAVEHYRRCAEEDGGLYYHYFDPHFVIHSRGKEFTVHCTRQRHCVKIKGILKDRLAKEFRSKYREVPYFVRR